MHTALSNPISTCEYYQNKNGHQINRRIELYRNQADLPKGWLGIQRLVKVRRWGIRNAKPFDEIAFYVLSKPLYSAKTVAQIIQGHWAVENKLHWIKDANLGEDDMSIKLPQTAALMAYLNNIAMNLITKAGMKPTKDTFAIFSNKVKELIKLF